LTDKVSDRFKWAVGLLDVKPADQLLEIGCGHGIVATLVCDRLTDGHITGIDRSATMIEMAEKRNSRCIAAGKARFYAMDLKTADLSDAKYDKILAINVNVFWQQPGEELSVVRRLLTEGGSLYLFFQPPTSDKATVIAQRVKDALRENGYSIRDEAIEALPSGAAVFARAEPTRGGQ
jgi:cyclopropane fatty-acyl-phospholipid synthase-like methyltransferase